MRAHLASSTWDIMLVLKRFCFVKHFGFQISRLGIRHLTTYLEFQLLKMLNVKWSRVCLNFRIKARLSIAQAQMLLLWHALSGPWVDGPSTRLIAPLYKLMGWQSSSCLVQRWKQKLNNHNFQVVITGLSFSFCERSKLVSLWPLFLRKHGWLPMFWEPQFFSPLKPYWQSPLPIPGSKWISP